MPQRLNVMLQRQSKMLHRLLQRTHSHEFWKEDYKHMEQSNGLDLMLQDMVVAAVTTTFASASISLVMTILSIIAVVVMNPVMAQFETGGYFVGCERCSKAFSSVIASI